jgi:glutamate dehydrogenase
MNKRIRTWADTLAELLGYAVDEQEAAALWQKYAGAFSTDYQELISPQSALNDILHLEALSDDGRQRVSMVEPAAGDSGYRLHFYSLSEHYLDEFIPVLENVNLRVIDQVQFGIPTAGRPATIKSYSVKAAAAQSLPLNDLKGRLIDTVQGVIDGRVENDALNKLVTLTELSWQGCDVLRTYRNYYLQIEHRTSKQSIQRALLQNPSVAQGLFDYFEARFRPDPVWQDPVDREEQLLFPLRLQLLEDMASVSNINDDKILRVIFNLIDATVRSNFHLRASQTDYFIAIKINSLGVIDMSPPKPLCEIYVHSVAMEGIHLRGGKVSRGGIRWSDRIDDFRTEILNLMQTQISKNALIIPTGAKGGFVVKPNGRNLDFYAAGKQAYITLMRGLLDLTDNYCNGNSVSPPNLVVHDDPDPYLVVAADKGTAKFSDIANGVAAEYGFWLGDAFASGGSHGYDHKALGITARGAWESVKRHFRELGKDIQQQPFTVVGIGSMDGDVFGNGMLLSPCIRLLAAFSGQHIFLDPDPQQLEQTLAERRRLFELPGSSWNDYDRNLLSAGGGVYLRSDKDIPLSTEVKKWLGIRFKTIDGESLIQYLLKAPVELLWLGGIGTYVKAGSEKSEDVGDRSNDNVRIDACDLQAKVVGEGANLGFTQKARIEYALRGGRINTDAVDNSAGVDTSDHEVNLKILLSALHMKSLIDDYQGLFGDMTTAVCRLVLADNYAQSLCLTLEQQRCAESPLDYMQVADRLEAAGLLDRVVEDFPQTKEIQARPGQTLTRPELAVLMVASKMYLTQQIEAQNAQLSDFCCSQYLRAYFPPVLTEKYDRYLSEHPLAKEIVATMVSNSVVNQAGCSFLSQDDTDNGRLLDYVKCYLAFDKIVDGESIRRAVYALDNRISAEQQTRMLLLLEGVLAEFSRWSVASGNVIGSDLQTLNTFGSYLSDYHAYLNAMTESPFAREVEQLKQAGVVAELAVKLTLTCHLHNFPFIVSLALELGQGFSFVLDLLNDIYQTLGLNEIGEQLAQVPRRDYWVRTVCNALQADIQQVAAQWLRKMVAGELPNCTAFIDRHADKGRMKHYWKVYLENQKTSPVNLLAYVTLVRALENLLEPNCSDS